MSEYVATSTSLLGQNIGRYRLEEQLGIGTRGITYRARHLENRRVVALKLMHEDVSRDARRRSRFESESAALAALAHPNLGTLMDYGVHEGRRWVAAEWLEGETLQARLQYGALPFTVALAILPKLLAALACAHGGRVVHRNLKPSNVFLERRTTQARERVKLLDFAPPLRYPRGAARGRAMPAEWFSPYSPPELAAAHALDARSDVFAVGATLIAMLIGEAEFEPPSAESGRPSLPSSPERARALPGVDASLMAWIRRATSPDRAVRFENAADMLRELIDLLPRDLRSLTDSGEGTNHALTTPISRPPPSPSTPAPSVTPSPPSPPGATPQPVPGQRTTGETVLPPPLVGSAGERAKRPDEFITVLWKGPTDGDLPGSDEAPLGAASAPATEPLDVSSSSSEGRGTLRPIEARRPATGARVRGRVQPLMAAGVLGTCVTAAFVIFLRSGTREGASTRASLQPHAAGSSTATAPMERMSAPQAPAVPVSAAADGLEAAKLPAASSPSQAPANFAASAQSAAPSIVAAPGRPRVRDPWQDPLPSELKRARELALNGAPGNEATLTMLREYSRVHHGDVRGHLLIASFYANRLWRTDAAEELQIALDKDMTARGAPELLPTLLDILAQGKAQALAEKIILKAYGSEALDAIDAAFDRVRRAGDAMRLQALRLKIRGAASP